MSPVCRGSATMRGRAVWGAVFLLGALVGRAAPFRVPHGLPACSQAWAARAPGARAPARALLERAALRPRAPPGVPARARGRAPLGLQMMAGSDATDRFANDLLCQVQCRSCPGSLRAPAAAAAAAAAPAPPARTCEVGRLASALS